MPRSTLAGPKLFFGVLWNGMVRASQFDERPAQAREALRSSFLREDVAAAGDGSARRSLCVSPTGTPMTHPELTAEVITEGMARSWHSQNLSGRAGRVSLRG
jgi:hypothetical protein